MDIKIKSIAKTSGFIEVPFKDKIIWIEVEINLYTKKHSLQKFMHNANITLVSKEPWD